MQRTRTNGHKFEDEFESACNKYSLPLFPIRLHTMNTRYAGLKNIADYIILSDKTYIIELKETSSKSFQTKGMQQEEELLKYQSFYKKASEAYDADRMSHSAFIIIHFIKEGKYVAYNISNNPFILLHPNDTTCITKDTLTDLIKEIVE